MSGGSAAGEIPGFAEGEARVGKGKLVEGGCGLEEKGVFSPLEIDCDADRAEDLQVAIETAYAETKAPEQGGAGLGALGELLQQSNQPGGPVPGQASRRASRAFLFGHGLALGDGIPRSSGLVKKLDPGIPEIKGRDSRFPPAFHLAERSRIMDFPDEPLEYLVVAAHPDDAEIGCGGAILSLKAGGARVGILDLTDGEPTPHGSPELRARETAAATAVLGVDWRGNLGLTNRCLTADLEARRKLAEAFRLLRPRVILAHYWEDAHPDHVAAAALTEAARFWAKLSKTDMAGVPHHPARLLYFFSVHLRLHLQPSFVLDVSPFQEGKMQALRCYRSQFIDGRDPTPPTILDEVLHRGRYWGWTIGASYGEPFLSREEIGLRNLQDCM